jgi:hypothetical protein
MSVDYLLVVAACKLRRERQDWHEQKRGAPELAVAGCWRTTPCQVEKKAENIWKVSHQKSPFMFIPFLSPKEPQLTHLTSV